LRNRASKGLLVEPKVRGSAIEASRAARHASIADLAKGAQASEGTGTMSKKHMGPSDDGFAKEEGIFEEAQAQA
jgi:hypothetical protein